MILDALNFLVVLSEVFMLCVLSHGFFVKKENLQNGFLLFLILLLGTFIITEFIGYYAIPKTIAITLLFTFWVKVSHNTQWSPSFFVVVFFETFLFLADSGILYFVSFCLNMSPSQLLESPASFYFIVYFAKSLEIVFVLLIHSVGKNRFRITHTSWTDWLHTAIIPIATLLLGIVLIYIYGEHPGLAQDLLLCAIILLITNVASIFLLEKLSDRQKILRDNTFLQQNLKKEQANLLLWEEAFKAQRKQTHDFQNHLMVLRGMLEKKTNTSEVSSYIERLIEEYPVSGLHISTHRTVVDIILSQKYTLATRQGINLVLQLDDLSAFSLPDDALTVVLANLLDNAIAAANKVSAPLEKYIKVKMCVVDNTSYLYIENTTQEPVVCQNNHVLQHTNTPQLHGYGIQNVRLILDQYDADYVLDYIPKTKLFIFSAQITTIDSYKTVL